MVNLCLLRFENTPHETLLRLGDVISNKLLDFIKSLKIDSTQLEIPKSAFNSKRQQYLAEPFLTVIREYIPSEMHGLALVNLDMFVPRLNFIFGLAEFGGNALVAMPRLSPIFYGHSENRNLYFERIVKEALHELGHVLGLRHCQNYCVMRFSNSLPDTDDKPEEYCPSCLSELS